MTKYLIFALFFLNTNVFAGWILDPGIYKGKGSIKDQYSNVECTYDIKITVGQSSTNEYLVIRDIFYHNPILCEYQSTNQFVIRDLGSGIFSVNVNNYDAEHGFCSANFCLHHLSYFNGSKVTEGIYRFGTQYTFTGMGTYAGGTMKIWNADLTKI